ncbi:tetratricopeptide repeat protein [Acinetobacter guillouiae]|uniref:tetratricopeptide repeat protein n=1 Tax=Acinetobacter guillouiae TaxID=106649 RepID=UPI003AF5B834
MNLQDAKEIFKQANSEYKQGNLEQAIELFSTIEKSSTELTALYATAQFSLGILLKKQNRLVEAEKAYKNVLREDQAESYAKAQFNLGILLKQQERFSEAEQAYRSVLKEDRAESYARAQLNLGVLLEDQEQFSEAEQAYKNVLREDRPESYAKAQLNLGNLLGDLKRFSEAEQAYKNVLREDRPESYAKAQLNLGNLLGDLKRFSEAEQAYQNVLREDRAESYAKAQLNLGILFKQQKRFAEAEEAYKNILIEEGTDLYTNAQFNLGILFKQQKRFAEAEEAYKKVLREDRAELYAKAQFNLGILFKQQKRFTEAEDAYKKVLREDQAGTYASAQFNLACLLDDLKRFTEAESAYEKVLREDQAELYAKAQFNLGCLLDDLKRLEETERAYKNIKYEDSPYYYALAQWNLYFLLNDKIYLKRIKLEHDLETYSEAQFLLGELAKNLNRKHNFWSNVARESQQYYKEKYQIDIVEYIITLHDSKCKNELFKIFEKVRDILERLFIDNEYEQFIAHYTNLTVSKLLLSRLDNDQIFKLKSTLRLNTINLMNDPEEGLLISKLLCLNPQITTQDLAFIACFTLHHDSLNQFRLYAKEGQKEASGLSLVLSKEFFSKEHNAARIYEKQKISEVTSKYSDNDGEGNTTKPINMLASMPLYRCIYFDPTSGLIKVAQREEWSFRREFKLEEEHNWFDKNIVADNAWKKYRNDITKIEFDVKNRLEELSKIIHKLKIDNLSPKEQEL